MSEPVYNTEDVVRYLDGEMSEIEKQSFEKSLSIDNNLREELERLRLTTSGVKLYGISQQVKNIHEGLFDKEQPLWLNKTRSISIQRVLRFGMAAAAILILVFVSIGGYKFYKLSPENLYDESFVAYNLSNVRSNEVPVSDIEKMYKEQNFTGIIKEAKKKVDLPEKDYLLTGLAHMELNDPFSAIYFFKKVTANTSSWYQQDAEYYLAMAYLKNHDYDLAISLMQKIRHHPEHIYSNQFSTTFIRKVKLLKWR